MCRSRSRACSASSQSIAAPCRSAWNVGGPLDRRTFSQEFAVGNGADPTTVAFLYVAAAAEGVARHVMGGETENGVKHWQWTGKGTQFQRFAAMPEPTLASLLSMTEATIIGFMRRARMLQMALHARRGLSGTEAQAALEPFARDLANVR